MSASGDVTGATEGIPQSNVAKDNAETADDASTVASKTDDDDDDQKKKNKGNCPRAKSEPRDGDFAAEENFRNPNFKSRNLKPKPKPKPRTNSMTPFIHPMLAANAAVYAIQNATTEGKATVIALLVLSLFSWTIIITKFRQLQHRAQGGQKVFRRLRLHARPAGHQETGEEFDGAPAYGFTIAARRNWLIS